MTVPAANKAMLMTGATQYFNGPAAILRSTRGIMFPIQPDITYQQGVNYSSYDLVHTNYSVQTYRNTPSPSIQVTAQFAQTTDQEHLYLQGVIHFLRSVTKMYYGKNEGSQPSAGTPPPVLRFSAFGTTVFSNLPVLVASFSLVFDSNVDLKTFGGQSLPTIQTIAMDLIGQQSPANQKENFSKAAFLSGSLYGSGFI